jgi:hypothetical protein
MPGKHPGNQGGRPTSLARVDQKDLASRSKILDTLNASLDKLAANYDDLMDQAIDMAKNGDRQVLLKLLELPYKVVNLDAPNQTGFDGLKERWTRTDVYERNESDPPGEEAADSPVSPPGDA